MDIHLRIWSQARFVSWLFMPPMFEEKSDIINLALIKNLIDPRYNPLASEALQPEQ